MNLRITKADGTVILIEDAGPAELGALKIDLNKLIRERGTQVDEIAPAEPEPLPPPPTDFK